MPSFILSILGADAGPEVSLPAPPVDLAHRLARATDLATTELDAIAIQADRDGDQIRYRAELAKLLASELARFDRALDSRLDDEGFVRGAATKTSYFNERQRLRAALQLFEQAATHDQGVLVQA